MESDFVAHCFCIFLLLLMARSPLGGRRFAPLQQPALRAVTTGGASRRINARRFAPHPDSMFVSQRRGTVSPCVCQWVHYCSEVLCFVLFCFVYHLCLLGVGCFTDLFIVLVFYVFGVIIYTVCAFSLSLFVVFVFLLILASIEYVMFCVIAVVVHCLCFVALWCLCCT